MTKQLGHQGEQGFQSRQQFEWSCEDNQQYEHLSKVAEDHI